MRFLSFRLESWNVSSCIWFVCEGNVLFRGYVSGAFLVCADASYPRFPVIPAFEPEYFMQLVEINKEILRLLYHIDFSDIQHAVVVWHVCLDVMCRTAFQI